MKQIKLSLENIDKYNLLNYQKTMNLKQFFDTIHEHYITYYGWADVDKIGDFVTFTTPLYIVVSMKCYDLNDLTMEQIRAMIGMLSLAIYAEQTWVYEIEAFNIQGGL